MTDDTRQPGLPSSWVQPPWHDSFPKLSEIGLDSVQQARVLEWYATRLWAMQEEAHDGDYCGKSYDPLSVTLRSDGSGQAHSYALSVKGGGGRHHDFDTLDDLERRLTQPMIDWMKQGAAAAEQAREDASHG